MYLNAHTFFSLRYGVFAPAQLVEAAAAQGVKTLVLTDINNTSAALEFVEACRQKGIKPVLGIEFRDTQHRFLFIGIARNNHGWAALNALLTEHSLAGKPLPSIAPPMDDVFVLYDREIKPLNMFRPNEFIGIRASDANKLFFPPGDKNPNTCSSGNLLPSPTQKGSGSTSCCVPLMPIPWLPNSTTCPWHHPTPALYPKPPCWKPLKTTRKWYKTPGACSTPAPSGSIPGYNSIDARLWAPGKATFTCWPNWQKVAASAVTAPIIAAPRNVSKKS